MELGESFVGSGAEAAHVNTMLGKKDGPVGHAWAAGLASPSAGHAPFVAVLQPGLPVKPFTLFVNKATIAGDDHARMTWGPAQAGVAVRCRGRGAGWCSSEGGLQAVDEVARRRRAPTRVGWMPVPSTRQGTSTAQSRGRLSIRPSLATLP